MGILRYAQDDIAFKIQSILETNSYELELFSADRFRPAWERRLFFMSGFNSKIVRFPEDLGLIIIVLRLGFGLWRSCCFTLYS